MNASAPTVPALSDPSGWARSSKNPRKRRPCALGTRGEFSVGDSGRLLELPSTTGSRARKAAQSSSFVTAGVAMALVNGTVSKLRIRGSVEGLHD